MFLKSCNLSKNYVNSVLWKQGFWTVLIVSDNYSKWKLNLSNIPSSSAVSYRVKENKYQNSISKSLCFSSNILDGSILV